MSNKPCLQLITVNQETQRVTAHYVGLHHYDEVKRGKLKGIIGFVEFDSCWGDGKVGMYWQDIREYILITELYAEEQDAWREKDRLTGDSD